MNFTFLIVGLYSAVFWGSFLGFLAAVLKFLFSGTAPPRRR